MWLCALVTSLLMVQTGPPKFTNEGAKTIDGLGSLAQSCIGRDYPPNLTLVGMRAIICYLGKKKVTFYHSWPV